MPQFLVNIIEKFISLNPKLLQLILNSTPPQMVNYLADQKALNTINLAMQNTKALKKFFKKNNIRNLNKVKDVSDIEKIPLINKENYFNVYRLNEVLSISNLYNTFSLHRSSGYSGKSFYWPTLNYKEVSFKKYVEFGLNYSINIDKYSTLIIICFALGSWIAGETTSRNIKSIAVSGKYKLSVISPGTNLEESIEIIKDLSPYYEQIVIFGYPPFLGNIVEKANLGHEITGKNKKIFLVAGGEGFTEEWREKISNKLKHKINDASSGQIYSAYGTAENGMAGCLETPLSVLIRRLCLKDKNLQYNLFKEKRSLPMLFQYNPLDTYLEEVNHELIFTQSGAVPLIRYNVGDKGGVIKFEEMTKTLKDYGYNYTKLLKDHGYTRKEILHLPFFYVFGRSDGTISLDGANIYPEDIKTIFDDITILQEEFLKALGKNINTYLKEIPYPKFIKDEVRKKWESLKIINNQKLYLNQIVNHFKISSENGYLNIKVELKEKFRIPTENIQHLENTYYCILIPLLFKKSNGYREIFLEKLYSSNLKIDICHWKEKEFQEDHKKIKRRYVLKTS